jgi:hypothetical protein
VVANKQIPPETDEATRPGVFNAEALLALLREFREGDQEDQKEQERELAEFMRAIDEDRPGGRKLFPEQ